jgi:hypothetical protein
VHLICDGIEAMQPPPALVVIDSIQTMQSPELSSAPGSITQVCDCTVNYAYACNVLATRNKSIKLALSSGVIECSNMMLIVVVSLRVTPSIKQRLVRRVQACCQP